MSTNTKTPNLKLVAAIIIGAALGAGALSLYQGTGSSSNGNEATSAEKKPLYWVAPMDSN